MSESASNKDVWSVVLKFADLATKVIVIAVPLLYFVGWAYTERFWKVHGIADQVMSYTTQELLRSGVIILLTGSLYMVATIVVCSALVIVGAIGLDLVSDYLMRYWASRVKPRPEEEGKGSEPSGERVTLTPMAKILQLATGTATTFMGLSVAYLLLLAAAIHPATVLADSEARDGVQSLQNHLTVDERFTLAYVANQPEQPRILIRCSNAACALYTGTGIEVVARDAVERMVPCAKVGREDGKLVCSLPFRGLLPE